MLENERMLRGVHCVDPDDKEFRETSKNVRKKLVLPMETAMLYKLKAHKHREICGGSDNQKKQSMHASQKPTSLREQVQLVKSLQLGAQVHSYAPAVD